MGRSWRETPIEIDLRDFRLTYVRDLSDWEIESYLPISQSERWRTYVRT